MQVLAAEPGEYSYFSENVLDMWAGPAHWKLKAQSKSRLIGFDGKMFYWF